MQDRYTGDIGDFGKYGLLRGLVCPARVQVQKDILLKLGVVWCLTHPEDNRDGRKTSFLDGSPRNQRRFGDCDPELYEALAGIVCRDERHVAAVQQRRILPKHAAFFGDLLTYDGTSDSDPVPLRERRALRRAWVDRACAVTAGCDLVFFDPDNGLPTARTRRHHRRGPKFIFYDELAPFIERGQSVVIYQHGHRGQTVDGQIQNRFAEIDEHFGLGRKSLAGVFRRFGIRSFIIVPAGRHGELVVARARAFLRLPGWEEHFDKITPRSRERGNAK